MKTIMVRTPPTAPWARAAYGVDTSGGALTVVRARKRGVRLRMACVPDSILARLPKRSAVAIALSPRESLTSWVEAPFNSRRKARRVFPTLLDIQLPFALDSCAVRFFEAEPEADGRGVRALGVACRGSDLVNRCSQLQTQGIDPHIIDQEGLALWGGSVTEHPPDEAEARRVVVCLSGGDATVVFGRHGRFVAAYTVPGARPEGIERMVIAQFGKAWRSDALPTCLIWCGGDAESPETVTALAAALALPAAVTTLAAVEPRLFLARSLARRALSGGTFCCDLRSEAFAHPAVTRLHARRRVTFSGFMAMLGIALIAGSLFVRSTAQARERAFKADFAREASRLAGFPVVARGEHAIQVVADAIDKRIAAGAPFAEALAPSLLSRLAAATRAAAQTESTISSLTLARDEFEATVTSPSDEGSAQFIAVLCAAGLDVEPSGIPNRDTAGRIRQRMILRGHP